jgi:Rrf2 family nitric oxide-sensitive transcriptional repressor
MRLTKTTSHAIRILIECAEANGGLVKAAEISKRLDITPLNVFKVIHLLSRAGFVEAVRGRNGGVRLARAASSIRIGEIVRAMEATQVEITGGGHNAINAKPRIDAIFDNALDAFISVLDQHTLADMAKGRAKTLQGRSTSRKARKRASMTGTRASALLRT